MSQTIATDPDGNPVPLFNWVGFDCYLMSPQTWETNSCSGTSKDNLISILRGLLTNPSQRLIAVPQTFIWNVDPLGTGEAGQQYIIGAELDRWQDEITSDGRYVLIMPFIWQASSPHTTSARDLWWGGSVQSLAERAYQLAYSFLPEANNELYPFMVSANASYTPATTPYAAFDRNTSTAWSSGGWAPQEVVASFGDWTHLGSIELTVLQNPAGPTTTDIYGYVPGPGWELIGSYQGTTQDGQVLSFYPNTDVSEVIIETTQSPSWVGWRDIRFFKTGSLILKR